MTVKFDKDTLEGLIASIRGQQTNVNNQVTHLLSAATRDPAGWVGTSGQRYDNQLQEWGQAQQQLDSAMTGMVNVIQSIVDGIDWLDQQAGG